MALVLSLLTLALLGADILSLDLSLAPGLSLKNAMLYAVAMLLAIRAIVTPGLRLELPTVHAAFAVLIVWALLSWLWAALVIDYQDYRLIDAAIRLKADLIDHMVFFLVFFYGLRTVTQTRRVMMVLLAGVMAANVTTVLDVAGLTTLGAANYDAGRVEGVIGEANQQAALDAMLLPLAFVAILQARGARRILWLGGTFALTAALVMTVSRGAFVALFVAAIWTAWIFRNYVSLGRIAGWGGAAALAVALTLLVLGTQFTGLLEERVVTQSLSRDSFDATSGRSYIWSSALERMAATPLSLFTGFGWAVYGSMGFRFAPHNHYLGLWFNLGIIGVGCFLVLLASIVNTARRAAFAAPESERPLLIAFVCGMLAISIAIFFVELHRPWLYVWAYAGCASRLALLARAAPAATDAPAAARAAAVAPAPPQVASGDLYGWTAGPRR